MLVLDAYGHLMESIKKKAKKFNTVLVIIPGDMTT